MAATISCKQENMEAGLSIPYEKYKFPNGLTQEKQLEIARKYIDPSRMYYVVVGDAKTQLNEFEKEGLGKPILVK